MTAKCQSEVQEPDNYGFPIELEDLAKGCGFLSPLK
jgi:hypothetical protein